MKQLSSRVYPISLILSLAFVLCLATTVAVALRVNVQDDVMATPPVSPAEPTTQPIAFSHQDHVTEMKIDCQFCHAYARRGPVAGIPSVQRCIGCHRTVLNDQPEIQKIVQYWENAEPIPWIRVHDLPDFVRFTHKRHLRAGVNCQNCHGNVGQMDIARQVAPLTMGWCVNCHKERQASIDCLTCHY